MISPPLQFATKTDQFNERYHKTLKPVPGMACQVGEISRLATMRDWSNTSEEKVFGSWLRNRPIATHRIAGASVGIPPSLIGNHSIISGGATSMWRAGYDIEVIKRCGRWKSASSQWYLWGDRRVVSSIGQGVILTRGRTYRFFDQGETTFDLWVINAGRPGGKGVVKKGSRRSIERLCSNPRGRMRDIYISKVRRVSTHGNRPSMQGDGSMALKGMLETASLKELFDR